MLKCHLGILTQDLICHGSRSDFLNPGWLFCVRRMPSTATKNVLLARNADLFGADLWDEFVILKKLTIQSPVCVCVFLNHWVNQYLLGTSCNPSKQLANHCLGPDISRNRSLDWIWATVPQSNRIAGLILRLWQQLDRLGLCHLWISFSCEDDACFSSNIIMAASWHQWQKFWGLILMELMDNDVSGGRNDVLSREERNFGEHAKKRRSWKGD